MAATESMAAHDGGPRRAAHGPAAPGLRAGPRRATTRGTRNLAIGRVRMTIDKATAARVAHLARIRVEDADLAPLAEDLGAILAFMEQLSEVDVDGVEPMTSVTPMALRRRADDITDGGIRGDILANAPDARDGFFTVPKVVE